MVKYFIYKVACLNPEIKDIYVGSTQNFKQRIYNHRIIINNPNDSKFQRKLYDTIRNNGGKDNWTFIVLEELECTKHEAHAKEHEYIIKLNATLNKIDCIKKPMKEYVKKYRDNNKEKINEYHKKYVKENPDIVKEINKRKYYKNRNKILEKKAVLRHCDKCDCDIRTGEFSRHEKSLKHKSHC